MPEAQPRHYLPSLMGSLQQQRAEGELVLEQNDGIRCLYWAGGNLTYLRSDAVGEQFGNFLVHRGVLDPASLNGLLEGDGSRVGDRIVQSGLMTVEQRDQHLHELFGSVLLHAMEHTIVRMTWVPGALIGSISDDLQFHLNHRRLVWEAFQNANIDQELVQMFASQPNWRWQAIPNLLESLSDLPLTPALAYAISLMGAEWMGCEILASLSGLAEGEAARLVAALWSIGALNLAKGELPLLPRKETPRVSMPTPVSPIRPRPASPRSIPPPPPLSVPEPEPELVITLMEEDPPTLREPRQRPRTLMDELEELDDPGPSPQAGSLSGPSIPRDPFVPPSVQSASVPPDPFSIPLVRSVSTPRDPFSPPSSPSPRAPSPPAPPLIPPVPAPSQDLSTPTIPLQDSESRQPQDLMPPSLYYVPTPSSDELSPVERAQQLQAKARSYLKQDRPSEAIRALEQSLKLDGQSPHAYEGWLWLGRLRQNNPAWATRAIEALQTAIHLNPQAAEPWVLMGEIYQRKGFYANALGCFRKALSLDPSIATPDVPQAIEDEGQAQSKKPPRGLMGRLRTMLWRG